MSKNQEVASHLDGLGLFVITDPRNGDVYLINRTSQNVRVRSIESAVAIWVPGLWKLPSLLFVIVIIISLNSKRNMPLAVVFLASI